MFRLDSIPEVLTIPGGGTCLVFDDILLEPERWRSRAKEFAAQFEAPRYNAYPGRELRLPETVTDALINAIMPWLQRAYEITHISDSYSRLSMVTLKPEQLAPGQCVCHRDRLKASLANFPLASVLYLFDNPALGGTHFFRPATTLSEVALRMLLTDITQLEPQFFFQRYKIARNYMLDSNEYFEKVLTVPARFNRMIVYPGMKFHSGDIANPQLLSENPQTGRLTFNGFFLGCKA